MIVLLPYLYFRYHTLRYTFDEEGIDMRVGILFRREVNLTYARIQDIHLRSGRSSAGSGWPIFKSSASGWPTRSWSSKASNNTKPSATSLYPDARLSRVGSRGRRGVGGGDERRSNQEMISLLLTIRDELRRVRETLGKCSPADHV